MSDRKLFPLNLHEEVDEFDIIDHQCLSWHEDDFDGMITLDGLAAGLSPVDADDLIYLIRLGMDLRDAGYDDIELKEIVHHKGDEEK